MKWGVSTYKEMFPPMRFKTREDAELWDECMRKGVPFPRDRYVIPYKLLGKNVVLNPEYKDAMFERVFILDQVI